MNRSAVMGLLLASILCLSACTPQQKTEELDSGKDIPLGVITTNHPSVVDGVEYPWKIGGESSIDIAPDNGVSLRLVEGTLTPFGASFQLDNQSGWCIEYGDLYDIEIRIGNQWRDILNPSGGPLHAFSLESGKTTSFEVSWPHAFGELPPGQYRIIKSYSWRGNFHRRSDNYMACEFEIQ